MDQEPTNTTTATSSPSEPSTKAPRRFRPDVQFKRAQKKCQIIEKAIASLNQKLAEARSVMREMEAKAKEYLQAEERIKKAKQEIADANKILIK